MLSSDKETEKDKYKGWSFEKIRKRERRKLFAKFLMLIPLNHVNWIHWTDGVMRGRSGEVTHRYIDEPILFNLLVWGTFVGSALYLAYSIYEYFLGMKIYGSKRV